MSTAPFGADWMEAGFLEVGITLDGTEVVINHPALDVDEHGVGHIVFSPAQARELARILNEKADVIEPKERR